MNNNITFYLARHGQTEWNIEHRIQGQLDSHLTELGKEQAMQLGINCMPLNLTTILTSSLGRALQTAIVCAQQLKVDVKQVDGFEERHFGCWQGKLTSEINGDSFYDEITSQVTDYKPESGESAKQSLIRFTHALKNELEADPNETVLVITHGDILRCFMASLLKEKQLSTGYDYKNAQLMTFTYNTKTKQFLSL